MDLNICLVLKKGSALSDLTDFMCNTALTDFTQKICYDFMHWLQNLPLHGLMLTKEAKILIATHFHGIRGNNSLGIFNVLTQERNMSGSKKIGP